MRFGPTLFKARKGPVTWGCLAWNKPVESHKASHKVGSVDAIHVEVAHLAVGCGGIVAGVDGVASRRVEVALLTTPQGRVSIAGWSPMAMARMYSNGPLIPQHFAR